MSVGDHPSHYRIGLMAQAHGDRLTATDASFLAQEGPSSHMHVGAVMIFEGPPPGYVDFVNQIRSRLHLVPRYRQKLAFPPIETGRPVWIDDPSFNLEYHVRHTALPHPGSEEQLRNLAARIHSQQLDRAKPLWETWLVQGLEGNRFALISKTHHALVDGISGVDLATVLFDAEPVPPQLPHEGEPWRPHAEPSQLDLAARGIRGMVQDAVRARRPRGRRGAPPGRVARGGPRGARGRRRDRLGDAQPRARHAAQRRDRPAPPLRVPARGARRLQARQERVRRHRQRRRADRRLGRAAEVAALARHAHRGARAARARPGLDPHPRADAAASATSSRSCAARCRSTSRTRSRG